MAQVVVFIEIRLFVYFRYPKPECCVLTRSRYASRVRSGWKNQRKADKHRIDLRVKKKLV